MNKTQILYEIIKIDNEGNRGMVYENEEKISSEEILNYLGDLAELALQNRDLIRMPLTKYFADLSDEKLFDRAISFSKALTEHEKDLSGSIIGKRDDIKSLTRVLLLLTYFGNNEIVKGLLKKVIGEKLLLTNNFIHFVTISFKPEYINNIFDKKTGKLLVKQREYLYKRIESFNQVLEARGYNYIGVLEFGRSINYVHVHYLLTSGNSHVFNLKNKWAYGRVFITSIKNQSRDFLYLLKEYLTDRYNRFDGKYKFPKYYFISMKNKKKIEDENKKIEIENEKKPKVKKPVSMKQKVPVKVKKTMKSSKKTNS